MSAMTVDELGRLSTEFRREAHLRPWRPLALAKASRDYYDALAKAPRLVAVAHLARLAAEVARHGWADTGRPPRYWLTDEQASRISRLMCRFLGLHSTGCRGRTDHPTTAEGIRALRWVRWP